MLATTATVNKWFGKKEEIEEEEAENRIYSKCLFVLWHAAGMPHWKLLLL